jgi:hypothetical protein
MATKFFKKFEPKLGVSTGGRSVILFPTLDGIIGYFATEDANEQGILQGFISAQRYGMSEITWTEFNESYVKKKPTAPPLRKPWREEMGGPRLLSGNPVPSVNAAAADKIAPGAVMADDAPSEYAVKAVEAVAAALKVPFQPPMGKRPTQ